VSACEHCGSRSGQDHDLGCESRKGKVAELHGSGGSFLVSTETGMPIDGRRRRRGYALVTRVDWDEWRRTYPGEDPAGMLLDVLDVGYWYDTGMITGYEPAAADWRREFADHRRSIAS
jgi:hypothetical protein